MEVLKIKCDNEFGYRFINLEEYDETIHEVFDLPIEPTKTRSKKIDVVPVQK